MHRLPAFKGAARQRVYGISGIQTVDKTVCICCEEGSFEFGKQALKSGTQVFDDFSRGEEVSWLSRDVQ